MNETRLRVLVIITVATLLGLILMHTQSANAAPLFGQGGVSKLQAHVYVSSSDHKEVKNVKVSVEYKGVVMAKTVTVRGTGYTEVVLVFPPIQMGWFDTFTTCVSNTNTGELNCKPAVYYFNRNLPQNVYLDLYNTS